MRSAPAAVVYASALQSCEHNHALQPMKQPGSIRSGYKSRSQSTKGYLRSGLD